MERRSRSEESTPDPADILKSRLLLLQNSGRSSTNNTKRLIRRVSSPSMNSE